jgi:hypothetical protein
MTRTCTICTHDQRADIETALARGEPYRHIADRFRVSTAALQRHKEHTAGPDEVEMSKGERDELLKLIRRQEKVAKTAAAQRSADLMADFERKLVAIYTPNDDAAFAQLYEEARSAVQVADARLAERCEELGIPKKFRPRLSVDWYGRGESALASRRAELRKVAQSNVAAMEQRAKSEIERDSLERQTRLLSGGLQSSAAQVALDTMPTVESLMPSLTFAEIAAAGDREAKRAGLWENPYGSYGLLSSGEAAIDEEDEPDADGASVS